VSAPSLSDSIERAIITLTDAGVASPRFDAWALASHVTDIATGYLQAQAILGTVQWDDQLDATFWQVVSRRATREPLWRITGKAPFAGIELFVGPGVFSPRPETELLAQRALEESASLVTSDGSITVVDLCAGTGAIGLWLAHQLPQARLLAVELSTEAAPYLLSNLEALAPGRAEALIGDVERAREHPMAGSVDVVVSNPPYLIPGEQLDFETATADPPVALFGGDDGLEVITRVIKVAASILKIGGVLYVEHGVGHREEMRKLSESAGFAEIHTEADLLGRDRFTRARLRNRPV
jgi:release factor glutamine methyltransferase